MYLPCNRLMGMYAGWGYIFSTGLIIMELRFNRAIRMRLHIFGIIKLWYKGIYKWEGSFLPNVTKMRPINGHRIGYNGVGVLRSQRPSKKFIRILPTPRQGFLIHVSPMTPYLLSSLSKDRRKMRCGWEPLETPWYLARREGNGCIKKELPKWLIIPIWKQVKRKKQIKRLNPFVN